MKAFNLIAQHGIHLLLCLATLCLLGFVGVLTLRYIDYVYIEIPEEGLTEEPACVRAELASRLDERTNPKLFERDLAAARKHCKRDAERQKAIGALLPATPLE